MNKIKKFLYSVNGENNQILNIVILILFLIISLYVGYYHEPWADEAQSWLIARDATVKEIIFNIARYEGTPAFWQLILKTFMILGFQYEYLYLISILFSVIGVYILVFKLEIPNIFKILLPFTYFILYEYTIKARSYCLLLPILSAIAWIYENRKAQRYIYNFLLGLLAIVSLHGFLISGILYLFEIFEILKDLKNNGNVRNSKKEVICVIILSMFYLFIIVTLYPASDIYVAITVNQIEQNGILLTCLFWIIDILEAIILGHNSTIVFLVISLLIGIALVLISIKGNKNCKLFLCILGGIIIFLCFIRMVNQHIGLILYTFLFALYITKNSIPEKNKKVLKYLFTIIFIIQIIWSYNNITLEIDNTYSAGRDVANYLKTLNYEELDICASGYYATAILPYFDNNIFDNDRGGKNYYRWSINNKDWYYASSKEYIYPENMFKNADVIILHTNYINNGNGYSILMESIRNSNKYKEKLFEGHAFFKGKISNDEGYIVFERID